MSASITGLQFGQAILDHVQRGLHPETEEIVSANLPPSSFEEVGRIIDHAQKELRIQIVSLSRSCAPDVDGWISQAKQLRADAERSEHDATDILEQARQAESSNALVTDVIQKTELLEEELRFNQRLSEILIRLQSISQSLDHIQRDVVDGLPVRAAGSLHELSSRLSVSSSVGSASIAGILESSFVGLKDEVVHGLLECWNDHILVDVQGRRIEIRRKAQNPDVPDLSSVAGALSQLGSFDDTLNTLGSNLERLIFIPRLSVRPEGVVESLEIEGDTMFLSGQSKDLSAQSLFSDLESSLELLQDSLPPCVMSPLMAQLVPRLVSRLISVWLSSSVPESLNDIESFRETLKLVDKFANLLDSHQWPGAPELFKWSQQIPHIWLRKRKSLALNQVRLLLAKGFGEFETVERVETQVLDQDNAIFATNGSADEWNDKWSDERSSSSPQVSRLEHGGLDNGEEDISAWGLDDEKHETSSTIGRENLPEVEDGADAWDWNDEQDEEGPVKPQVTSTVTAKPTQNGPIEPQIPSENTMTLKESFRISAIPRAVLGVLQSIISDLPSLITSSKTDFPIKASVAELSSLLGLVLAMFRASASGVYTLHPHGGMSLYNDCLWLAEQVEYLDTAPLDRDPNFSLRTHVSALKIYGKRSYAKEMESERTILKDLLDGAQGFANCTQHPFNQECDVAVATTVDRVRMLYKEWSGVLSRTATLQSIGSLVSTITAKILLDIEDMMDISEPESQQLSRYCSKISALEDIFVPDTSGPEQQAVPVTPFYVSNWFKFQYLVNILESSLVDIKFMWTESELSLEFTKEEVTDLILALFADSHHRRTAIAEIRATNG